MSNLVRKELKKLRIDYDLSQKVMAEKLGISAGAYSLIENGKRHGNSKTWEKIKEILNISDEKMWEIQNPKV